MYPSLLLCEASSLSFWAFHNLFFMSPVIVLLDFCIMNGKIDPPTPLWKPS